LATRTQGATEHKEQACHLSQLIVMLLISSFNGYI